MKGGSVLITDGLDLIKKLVNILENESQEKIDEILMNNEDNTNFITIANNINNHGKETEENIPFKEFNNTKTKSTKSNYNNPALTEKGINNTQSVNNFTIEESNIVHPTPTPNKTQ